MASVYRRKNSKVWYIKYKTADGKWKDKSTGLRIDDISQTATAKRLEKAKTLEEVSLRPMRSGADWDAWVANWISERWGHKPVGRTIKLYTSAWKHLQVYFKEVDVRTPLAVSREHLSQYIPWRSRHGGGRNVAIYELRFLGAVLDEAINRGFVERNVSRGLRPHKEKQTEKSAWTDAEIANVGSAVEELDRYGWMRVTLLLGLFQACRIGQCAVPLADIDLSAPTLTYSSTKGDRPFTHSIDQRVLSAIADIVRYRQSAGASTLCDLPYMCSVHWRILLDCLNLPHLSHHGLRVTWITRAARAGVPENIAMRFVNHSSTAVHQIYQKLSVGDVAESLSKISMPEL
jgi:integrase